MNIVVPHLYPPRPLSEERTCFRSSIGSHGPTPECTCHGHPCRSQGVAGRNRLLGCRAERRAARVRRRRSRRGARCEQQADDALQTIEAVIGEHGARGSIVHQAVFVRDVGQIDECRAIIREFYGARAAGHQLHPAAALRRQAAGDRGPGRRPRPGRGPDRARQRAAGDRPAQRHRLGPRRARRPADSLRRASTSSRSCAFRAAAGAVRRARACSSTRSSAPGSIWAASSTTTAPRSATRN